MKRIMILAVVAFFVASLIPAFAEQPKKEDSLFKIVQDTLKPGPGKEKNKVRNPLPKVSVFQNMANGIKKGSAKARGESLRTEKTK